MGSFAVASAIRDLFLMRPQPPINTAVFAAADIDSSYFMQEFASPLAHAVQHVTLYASRNDKAISFGERLNGFHRVGHGPNAFVVGEGIDYIDASDVKTDLVGHGYFRENKQVIDDLHYLLVDGLPPERRQLMRVPVPRMDSASYFRIIRGN